MGNQNADMFGGAINIEDGGEISMIHGNPMSPVSAFVFDTLSQFYFTDTNIQGFGGMIFTDRVNGSDYGMLQLDMANDRLNISVGESFNLLDTSFNLLLEYNVPDSIFAVNSTKEIVLNADTLIEILTNSITIGADVGSPLIQGNHLDSTLYLGNTFGSSMLNFYGKVGQQTIGFGDSIVDFGMVRAGGWARITSGSNDLQEVGFDIYDADSSGFLFNATTDGDPFFQIGDENISPNLYVNVSGWDSQNRVLTTDGTGLSTWEPLTLQTAYDNGFGSINTDNDNGLTFFGPSNFILNATAGSTDTVPASAYQAALVINPTRSTISLGASGVDLEWLNYKRGFYSHTFGRNLYSPSYGELSVGQYNTNYTPDGGSSGWDVDDRLFSIGNGQNSGARSMALVVLKSGNMGLGTETPSETLDVDGSFQYVDGNEAAGAVLISDADGVANWTLPTYAEMGFGDSTSVQDLTVNVEKWITNPNNDLWSSGAIESSGDIVIDGDSVTISTDGVYEVEVIFSGEGAVSSVIELGVLLNGSESCFCTGRVELAASKIFPLPYHDIITLSSGDVLKPFIMNTNDSNDVTAVAGKMIITRIK
jgi:hypothetical protein